MCTILLSINPEYVESIMSGKKKYEFRKNICKRNVEKIIIYSTSPVMKIVGEAEVEDILIDEPKKIWNITKKYSGVKQEFFDEYYNGRMQAVAYKLKHIKQYDEPKELQEYGVKAAPQSFCYLNAI